MKNLLIQAMIFVLLLSGVVAAQQARFYAPPIQPVPGYVAAVPELRIYDAGVYPSKDGMVFQATVQALIWEGLDNEGEAIQYKPGSTKDSQFRARSYRLMDKKLSARAYLFVYGDKTIIERIRFDIKGGMKNAATIKFKAIPFSKKILTSRYTISVELYPAQQGSNKNSIWIDEEINVGSGDQKIIERQDPRRVLPIRIDCHLLVNQRADGSYEFAKEGEMAYYEKILVDIKRIRNAEKELAQLEKEIQNPSKTQGQRGYLASSISTKKQEIQKLNNWIGMKSEIEQALNIARKNEGSIRDMVQTQEKLNRKIYREFLLSVRDFYSEIAWTGNLCIPNWKPSKKTLAKAKMSLSEIIKKYKVTKLVSGTPGNNIKVGAWKRDRWMNRVNNEWLPRIAELKKDFRKLFGKAMDENSDAKETDQGYFGLNEKQGKNGMEYESTFWQPIYKSQYENIFKNLFKKEILETLVKAYSNLLAYQHTESGKKVVYPYRRANSERPDPNWSSTESVYNRLSTMKNDFCRILGGCEPKASHGNTAGTWKKPKTKWVCPSCGCTVQFKPPTGKCPVCGTKLREVANEDTPETGPSD